MDGVVFVSGPQDWATVVNGVRRDINAAENRFDIRDYGAAGNNFTDAAPAISKAIEEAADAYQPGSNSRTAGMSIIYIPSNAGEFYLDSLIEAVGDKSIALVGDGRGSVLRTGAGVDQVLFRNSDSQFKELLLLDLMLLDCGVGVAPNSRNRHRFINVFFKNSPGPAITLESDTGEFGGLGQVVGGEVLFCEFEEGGGILCKGEQSDNWAVAYNYFTRLRGCDVQSASSGWLCEGNVHEARSDSGQSQHLPHYNFDGPSISRIRILNNRAGNEVTPVSIDPPREGAEPPREFAVFGPIDGVSQSMIADCHVIGNQMRGRAGLGPTADSANVFVRYNRPPKHNIIRDNYVFDVNTAIVEFADGLEHRGVGNRFEANSDLLPIGNNGFKPLFHPTEPAQGSGGGWQVNIRAHDAEPIEDLGTEQLLNNTEDIDQEDTWAKVNVTVAHDAEGPDGLPGSAYTITKPSTGTAHLLKNFTGNGRDVFVSCYVRAVAGSGIDRVRFYVDNMTDNDQTFPVFEERWYQIGFWAPTVDLATYSMYLGVGSIGTALTGAVLFAFPSVTSGRKPRGHVARPGSFARPVPGGSLLLNRSQLVRSGPGASLPAIADHGDMYIVNDATAGQPFKYYCTAAGDSNPTAPTWVVTGTLP